jgi:hypothetical protein
MKIIPKNGYILIISPTIVYFFGLLAGVAEKAKGSAFFPFIFIKSDEFVQPWLITHERIHFRQQIETLFVGSILLSILEKLYAHFILKKSWFDSYLWSSGEQEAYLNQSNPEYLKSRKFWSQFFYLKNKRRFVLGNPGEVILK